MTEQTIIDVPPFEILGPLPTGVTVLEASAGTGKTYTIAALAARYVADGLPLESLLVVTFTRAATGELRERVRERLVSAERALDEVVTGGPPPVDDEVAAFLADGSPEEVLARRDRLSRAVADFDAATIVTTHGFCQEVLSGLGFAGDIEHGTKFAEDISDVLAEVVDDFYIRKFRESTPQFDRKEAGAIVAAAVANPAAHLEPSDPEEGSVPAMRVGLATKAREELERRKRLAAVMTYDDLLTRLNDTLQGPGGADVAARLSTRFRVVLVDEFQDTDPVQWEIMRRAFGEAGSTLVLIGDPKQAIYAFRGADVYAYLEAAKSAVQRATLGTNWRSDQPLLTAYDALFARSQLGHEGIVYRDTTSAGANVTPRLSGAPDDTPLRVRVVSRGTPTVGVNKSGSSAPIDDIRAHIATDVSADIVELLSSAAQIETRHEDGSVRGTDVVSPGDIAVLVRTHWQAGLVRDALAEVGVPVVVNGAGSVFLSPGAGDWLTLLQALERPTSPPRARAAALTPFFGWSAARLAAASDDDLEELHGRLHEWAEILRVRGVASLAATMTAAQEMPATMLAFEGGEREITDLRHVAQLLHATAVSEHLGTAALTTWLHRRIDTAGQEGDEQRIRRLESDAAAVQILTIHGSKGLEFPVVYCPFLFEPGRLPEKHEPIFFHDSQRGDRRTLDVGIDGAAFAIHTDMHRAELRGEDLRLAYVALTRARHQAVVWWAPSHTCSHSALGRLLWARAEDGAVATDGGQVPSDQDAYDRFVQLAAVAPGHISVAWSIPALRKVWAPDLGHEAQLAAATFDRELDHAWRRTSYSAITADAASEHRVDSEPEEDVELDEEGVEEGPAAPVEDDPLGLRSLPSLLADMPGGTHVGSLLHEVLETVEFDAEDLAVEVAARLAEGRVRRPVDVGSDAAVVDGLCAALTTPLGPLAGDRSLRSLARADRIDEMNFELPLVGGVDATGSLTAAALGEALQSALPADDPLHAYGARLADPTLWRELRGYLTGSIDLVFRMPDADGRTAYGIADYKTNRLGAFGTPLTLFDYRASALRAEMYRSHYALQGLLYTVALHRFLRWRVADYDPDTDIAGVFYLFLRGMGGVDTPRDGDVPCGVFAWRPPAGLVMSLSDLLDEGAASS